MNININLIRKKGDLYDLLVRDNKIIELYHNDGERGGELSFFIYEPKNNTITEVEPEVRKADFVNIRVAYKPCTEVYYATCKDNGDATVDINLYAYNITTKETRFLFSLNESATVLSGLKRIKVFVLSRTQMLIQTEIVDVRATDSLMGNIVFTQALYDTETNEPIEIIEENFNNNGINSIVPLNETDIMIKTGFSYLEDSRLTYGSEKDALIESVYITSTAKFVADIALKLTNIDMKLLVSTYFDRYILKPEVRDDYIFYNIVDLNNRESDCVFYNYVTGEKITGKNTEIEPEDLRLAYVIRNTPYVRKYIEDTCEFVNLLSAENDISFYDEDFVDVCGDLFITYRRHGRRNHLRIYRYPHMDVITEEKCVYVTGIAHENNYYIYIT